MTTPQSWWGRVFSDACVGGNHTVIVFPGTSVPNYANTATRFNVPDTGFITSLTPNEVTLRTFSPYEELAQCLQPMLATLTALSVPDGEHWLVRHEKGELLEVHREGSVTWARDLDSSPVTLEDTLAQFPHSGAYCWCYASDHQAGP